MKIFFGIIWDLFISDVKWKLCLIFQNFQNGHHFELATNFFTGSYTGSWIYQKDSHEHFGHIEPLIDALAQILTEIYQFQKFDLLCDLVTLSMTSWICIYINVVIISRNQCTGSFVMISLLVFLVVMKNVVISFIKEYRGPTLRPPCDVIDDVIIMKILFLAKFGTIFSYLRSDWSCVKYFKIFKMAAILSSRQTFLPEIIPEVGYMYLFPRLQCHFLMQLLITLDTKLEGGKPFLIPNGGWKHRKHNKPKMGSFFTFKLNLSLTVKVNQPQNN